MVVAVIGVNAYSFLDFPDLTCHLEDTGRNCFLVALCPLMRTRPNLEVATKRLLHQQVKILGQFQYHAAHRSVFLELFPVVWILPRSMSVICYSQLGLQKLLQGSVSHELTAYLPDFYLFGNLVKCSYYQKYGNQINLNHTNL